MFRVPSFFRSVGLFIALTMPLAAQDQIPWLSDLRQARQQAEQNQRLVLLHFWSDNCLPCRALEQNVFNQPELVRVLATNYVPVKINVMQQPRYADFYKIDRVPTDVIVDASGRELSRRTSPSNSNSYIAMLDQVRASYGTTGGRAGENLAATSQPSPYASALPPRADQVSNAYADDPSEAVNASPAIDNQAMPARDSGYGLSVPTPVQRTTVQNQFVSANAPLSPSDLNGEPGGGGTGRYAPAGAALQNSYLPPGSNSVPTGGPRQATPKDALAVENGTQTPPYAAPGLTSAGSHSLSAPHQGAPNLGAPSPGMSAPGMPAAGMVAAAGMPFPGMPSAGMSAQGPQSPPAASAQGGTANLPPNIPPVCIDGFCPVTLVSMTKWIKGDPRWGAVHRGRTYLLASQAEQQMFLKEPDRYSPALSGYDPVRFAETHQLVDGRREYGVFFAGTYYLFADEASLVKFETQPHGYVNVVRQAMANTAPSR